MFLPVISKISNTELGHVYLILVVNSLGRLR